MFAEMGLEYLLLIEHIQIDYLSNVYFLGQLPILAQENTMSNTEVEIKWTPEMKIQYKILETDNNINMVQQVVDDPNTGFKSMKFNKRVLHNLKVVRHNLTKKLRKIRRTA